LTSKIAIAIILVISFLYLNMSSQTGLKNLRKKIDDIDDRLLDLLNERSQIALKISKQKKRGSHEVYDPVREKEIEIKLKKNNRGPFPTDSIISVFREIISACRSLQNPVKVAYLGPEGSFSHQAVYKKFGSSSELLPQRSFEEIFEEIDTERATFGIVPLENSEEGSVGAVLDLLSTFSLSVCSEYYEKINHYLLSKSTKKSDVRIVAEKGKSSLSEKMVRREGFISRSSMNNTSLPSTITLIFFKEKFRNGETLTFSAEISYGVCLLIDLIIKLPRYSDGNVEYRNIKKNVKKKAR